MKGFFITGTDTNVGKTLVAAILTKALAACYWKPIQSGTPTDFQLVQTLVDLPTTRILPSRYVFQAPLSPNQAAAREDIQIDLADCHLPNTAHPLIVEGAGGIYVPLNSMHSMLDLIQQLQLPVVIVTRGVLGTINHTLMTIDVLQRKKIPIHGLVFSGELNPESQKNIEEWSGVKTLFHVPPFNELNRQSVQQWLTTHAHFIQEKMCETC